MNERVVPGRTETDAPGRQDLTRQNLAMTISVLLFVIIYLWGFVSGLTMLSKGRSRK